MIRRGFSQVGPSAPNRGAAGFVHCAFQAFRVYTKIRGPNKHKNMRILDLGQKGRSSGGIRANLNSGKRRWVRSSTLRPRNPSPTSYGNNLITCPSS